MSQILNYLPKLQFSGKI